jgi:UDP-N-acetyl-D-glucosamine dehydrogenase
MQSSTLHDYSTLSADTRDIRTIAVVGLGYVGLPLAILAESCGYVVRGYDTDAAKVEALSRRKAPFLSAEEATRLASSHIRMSTESAVLAGADAFIVCVPTPVDEDHMPDLRPLASAARSVARYLERGALVVIESTVNPGACEAVALPILERGSGLRVSQDFFFAHCPERINPGDPKWTVGTIPRVIGASDATSLAKATALYRDIIDADIVPMGSVREAEAVKMVENAFRDVNIAFVNELAMSFARAGIDITNVIRGASTKPFSFMPHFPGCGVGGHCIPVDPYYLIHYGEKNGFEHRFLKTAREINEGMPSYVLELLEEVLDQPLTDVSIALLGLSYKSDVPDLRESPALVIRELLVEKGAQVRSYDPLLPGESNVPTMEAALTGADAALIATDHSAFSTLGPGTFEACGVKAVVDGRNCLDKAAFIAAGIAYRGIGR